MATFPGQFRTNFLSRDGRYVFFTTASALVPDDANGRPDVYEYAIETGQVALLSTGTGPEGAWLASASADGSNVFILTRQQVLAGDIDTLDDLYDVRVDGGFVQPHPEIGGCVGDECQGTPTAAPSFNTANEFHGEGNLAPSEAKHKPNKHSTKLKRRHKLKEALARCRRRYRDDRGRRDACERRVRRKHGARATPRRAQTHRANSKPRTGRQ